MSKNHAVAKVFDALIEQTQQRGGSPSVREISDAALAVSNLVAAYAEVRAHALQAGMSESLVRAIEIADITVAIVEGREVAGCREQQWWMNVMNSDRALSEVVASMNESSAAKSAMKIGEVITHPDGYQVKVLSGQYLDSTYRRVTNFWTWARVNEDGSLGEEESGYGWQRQADHDAT